jgi:hypothetical protein
LLLAHPHLRGVVFDLPHVEGEATAAIELAELSGRCRFAGGSFFESVPPDADVYVMSAILHDWDDAAAGAILQTLRAAMRPDSRLLLLESVLADGDEPDVAKLADLHMLVALGGRERTEPQWRALLAGAGFHVDGIRPGLVEARTQA